MYLCKYQIFFSRYSYKLYSVCVHVYELEEHYINILRTCFVVSIEQKLRIPHYIFTIFTHKNIIPWHHNHYDIESNHSTTSSLLPSSHQLPNLLAYKHFSGIMWKHKLMFYLLCNFNVELETIIVSFGDYFVVYNPHPPPPQTFQCLYGTVISLGNYCVFFF